MASATWASASYCSLDSCPSAGAQSSAQGRGPQTAPHMLGLSLRKLPGCGGQAKGGEGCRTQKKLFPGFSIKVGSRDNGKPKPADSTGWGIRSKRSPRPASLQRRASRSGSPRKIRGGQAKSLLSSKSRSKSQELPPPSPLPDQPQARAPLTISASCSPLLTAPEVAAAGRKPPVSQTAHMSINVSKHTQRRPRGHSRKKKNRLCRLRLVHPLGNDILAHLCGRLCAASLHLCPTMFRALCRSGRSCQGPARQPLGVRASLRLEDHYYVLTP